MATVFLLGNTDYSGYVNRRKINIDTKPVYEKWTDGNAREHRDVIRWKVSGDITLTFFDPSDYDDFKADFDAKLQEDNTHQISVFSPVANGLVTADAFLTLDNQTVFATLGTNDVAIVVARIGVAEA